MKAFILLIAVVASCFQGTEGGSCETVDEEVELLYANALPCRLKRLGPDTIQYRSHGFIRNTAHHNYPGNYPDNRHCDLTLSSNAPYYLEVKPVIYLARPEDKTFLKRPFGQDLEITTADEGLTLYAPTANKGITFDSDDKKRGKGFSLEVTARTSDCHRVCNVSEGDTGVLETGPYTSNKFCEWWINGPDGCNIQLDFTELDVGTAGVDCSGDYVGVAKDGDRTYSTDSENFCGSTVPGPVTSSNSQLNVLFNGQEGGYQGFNATYTVVCPVTTTTAATTTAATTTAATTTAATTTAPTTTAATTTAATTTAATTTAPTTTAATTTAATTTAATTTAATTTAATTTAATTTAATTTAPTTTAATTTAATTTAATTTAVTTTTTTAPTPTGCTSLYTYVEGLGCLHFGFLPFHWNGANVYCLRLGATLISTDTEQQTLLLSQYLLSVGAGGKYWVGVTKPGTVFHRRWQWNGSRRPVTAGEWSGGRRCAASTNFLIRCASFNPRTTGPLCSAHCGLFYRPICQLPPI